LLASSPRTWRSISGLIHGGREARAHDAGVGHEPAVALHGVFGTGVAGADALPYHVAFELRKQAGDVRTHDGRRGAEWIRQKKKTCGRVALVAVTAAMRGTRWRRERAASSRYRPVARPTILSARSPGETARSPRPIPVRRRSNPRPAT